MENNTLSGKIAVKGRAAKRYPCDRLNITIKISCKRSNAAQASEAVLKQCGSLLRAMVQAGADVGSIRLQSDEINEPYNEEQMRAQRTLEFDTPASANVNNFVLGVIAQHHLDAQVKTKYYLSNEQALRRELRKEAVCNAAQNARLLAAAAERELAGVDAIDFCQRETPDMYLFNKNLAIGAGTGEKFSDPISQFLSAPETELTEEVYTVWLLR